MKLKKLLLQGYKTFASKTEFVFDDGVTAVVGPNGSGKSNVADAVRWVLGEQSYSTLRGKKTVDMIFAGSQKRARAGMAQATLTLDNSDGWLPIDYAEVEITRRAYRSGENEYLLNGQKVRLMDINDLLARAGIAEQSYTIIGQGLIDQALSQKPEERRALFEEAAGISHYKAKRATTLRKLQETQSNLLRANDILSEIKPRLSSLKRQADRAENYHQVAQDLRYLLRIWYGYRWEQAKKTLRARRQEAAAAENQWRSARDQLINLQGKQDEKRQELHGLQEALEEKQAQRDGVRERLETVRREVAILQERRAAIERQLADSSDELPLLESQQKSAQLELGQAMDELTAVQGEMDKQQAELRTFEASFQQQQAAIDQQRRKVRDLEQTYRQTQNQLSQAEGQLSQLKERLAEQDAAVEEGEEAADLEDQASKLAGVVKAAEENAQELRDKRKSLQDERQKTERSTRDLRRELDQLRRQLNEASKQVARQQARVEMLDRLRTEAVKVGKDVKVTGQLARFLTIPADYQQVLDLALQARLSTLIVPDEENLWRIVKQRSAKQALDLIVAQGLNGAIDQPQIEGAKVLGWANQLVQCEAALQPVANALLGRVLLVADAETAYQTAAQLPAGCAAVSPDGLIAHSSGLIELVRSDGQNSILAREEEWRQAQKTLEEQQTAQTALEQAAEGQNNTIREQQKAIDDAHREEQRLGRLENEANQRVQRAQRDLDRVKQQQAFLERQRESRKKERAQLEQRIYTLEKKIAQEQEDANSFEDALAEARTTLQAMPIAEAEQQRTTLKQQMNATRSIVDGRRAIVDSRRTTLSQIEKQMNRLQERRQEWSQQLLRMNVADNEKQLADLQTQMDALNAELEPLQEQLRQTQRQMRELEGETAVAQRVNHQHETRYTQTKVALSQHETQIDNIKERIRTDLGLVSLSYDDDQTGDTPLPLGEVIEQLESVPEDELPEDIEESIQKRRNQLSRMGSINPDAPAEYEEVLERHDFLEQQLVDLEQTDKHLRKIVDELDDLTSRAFAETVNKVNGVFGEMFTRLFGGGSAELVLTDPDDLTVSGVDISARLPGRRPQGLALLSGGERSLTAASLIFALLKVSPTPFCMMDEVDAALDEANVTRFRDVLLELQKQTQFIVITHNRGTVQAAQTIYGITMGDDSASQVISIKPDEYVAQAELIGVKGT